jgi:ElaB/YqjD/DUF883 family membrane-anchored ribosome-binding protein
MGDSDQATREFEDVLREIQAILKNEARNADRLLREHPWLAMGIAAAGGFAVGMLAARRPP